MKHKIKDKKKLILDIVKKESPISATAIGEKIHANYTRTIILIEELIKSKKIKTILVGKKNYYQLNDDE